MISGQVRTGGLFRCCLAHLRRQYESFTQEPPIGAEHLLYIIRYATIAAHKPENNKP